MNRSFHHRLATCLAVTAAVAGVLAASAPAQSRPARMSQDAYGALSARSEGLNRLYHLGGRATDVVPAGMSLQAYQALRARSEAMNERYLGKGANPLTPPPATTTGTGFDWTNVAVGVAAAAGVAVLVGAGVTARAHRHPPVRPSH